MKISLKAPRQSAAVSRLLLVSLGAGIVTLAPVIYFFLGTFMAKFRRMLILRVEHPGLNALSLLLLAVACAAVVFQKFVDNLIGKALSGLYDSFVRENWRCTYKQRKIIYNMLFCGIVLILLFPFGLWWTFAEQDATVQLFGFAIHSPFSNDDADRKLCYGLWEFAVISWSALFLTAFVWYQSAEHLSKHVSAKRQHVLSLVIAVIVFGVIYCAVSLIKEERPQDRVLAELAITLLVVFCDIVFLLVFKFSKDLEARHDSNSFLRYLFIVDLPGLFAFAVLWVFLREANAPEWGLPFAAGAAALNLLLINTIFSAYYMHETYLGRCAQLAAKTLIPQVPTAAPETED